MLLLQSAKAAAPGHLGILRDASRRVFFQLAPDRRVDVRLAGQSTLPEKVKIEEFVPPAPHWDWRRRSLLDQQGERVRGPDRLVQIRVELAACLPGNVGDPLAFLSNRT